MHHHASQPRMIPLPVIEYMAAAAVWGFGFWVVSWGDDAAIRSAAFAALRQNASAIGPPFVVVGLGAIVVGAAYTAAIHINGRGMSWTPIVRAGCAVLAASFMANLAASIYAIQPSSTGVYTYAALSIGYFSLFVAHLDRVAASIHMIAGRIHGKSG